MLKTTNAPISNKERSRKAPIHSPNYDNALFIFKRIPSLVLPISDKYMVIDKTTKDIAGQLFISEKTVRNHISNVMHTNCKYKATCGLSDIVKMSTVCVQAEWWLSSAYSSALAAQSRADRSRSLSSGPCTGRSVTDGHDLYVAGYIMLKWLAEFCIKNQN